MPILENNYILFANDRNRVCGAVLGLAQDGACTHLFENFREHSLKRDLSNDTSQPASTPLNAQYSSNNRYRFFGK
jgi:hypothetical protein